ncbi:MAG TPA: S-methyl-5-thioribose-1-phosphate isomerase [Candidatus Eisenbacteria bacterium]|nr:S-methyl-5-thioribose-1-phosphate isomerase [Candidatus Eisenbacteria bacterium]
MSRDPFRFEGDHVLLLDQTLLPDREETIEIQDARAMADAISRLAVRGAPAIGIAAALALAVEATREGSAPKRLERLEDAGRLLVASRPTAVNLSWAVDRVLGAARRAVAEDPEHLAARVRGEALAIWDEDRAASRAMAEQGASLFPTQTRFLTHCNTGALATGGGGTALAVLLELHRRRPSGIEVWATETRPLLQGARLTAWELREAGVPFRLITDSAAAHTILRGGIEGVLVGADRIARNGDSANKIGTLGLALAAHAAGIPFVVVAPTSTIDPRIPDGAEIAVEARSAEEVTAIRGMRLAPTGIRAENPAFDVTPARWIYAIVTERGVHRGPAYDLGGAVDTKTRP